MLSRRFVGSLALFCVILALVDPLIFQKPVILPVRMLFWLSNGIVAVAMWYGLFRLALWGVSITGRDIPVPSALLIALAVTGLLHFNYGMGMVLLDSSDLWRGRLYPDVLRYSAVAVLFEAAVAAFVVPGVLRALRWKRGATTQAGPGEPAKPAETATAEAEAKPAPPPAAQEPSASNRLTIDGETLDLDDLLYLKAAEHYVEIIYGDTTKLVRSSLRDVVARLHPDAGIQPHRSYWVSRDAIIGMNRRKGAQFLVLSNGDEIPVSRQKKAEVGRWVQESLLKKGPGTKPGQVQQGGAYHNPDMRGLD